MASWPRAQIPYSDISWSLETKENVIRFEPERGRSKVRRISTKPVETLSITLSLSSLQFRSFRYWYRYDLNDGVLSFVFPDFIDNGNEREARFAEIPSYSRKDESTFSVTAKVEFIT